MKYRNNIDFNSKYQFEIRSRKSFNLQFEVWYFRDSDNVKNYGITLGLGFIQITLQDNHI